MDVILLLKISYHTEQPEGHLTLLSKQLQEQIYVNDRAPGEEHSLIIRVSKLDGMHSQTD